MDWRYWVREASESALMQKTWGPPDIGAGFEVGALSSTAMALVPPKPKEFTRARRRPGPQSIRESGTEKFSDRFSKDGCHLSQPAWGGRVA